ncbi:MAG TPA: S53 family peptidase [Myxococcales bacterium]
MPERKVFADSIIPLPRQPVVAPLGLLLHDVQPEHRQEKMTLLFSLAPDEGAQRALEQKVARGETVAPADLQGYGAAQPRFDALVSWLKDEGFEIVHTTPDRTSVYAQATVDVIEKSLGVDMVRVTKDGITWSAARNAPSLPVDVGAGVHAIVGLQPFRHANKHFRKAPPKGNNREFTLGGPVTNIANQPPYLVSEVLKAYGADKLKVTGKGQKIAILIDTVPEDADLHGFWKHNGVDVTLSQVEKVNVGGGHLPPAEGEETLDVEWSSGVAPGATVRVYACGSLSFVDLDRALDRIIEDLPSQPTMRQLSISLGLGETFMSRDEVDAQHHKFLRLAAAGVNVFVSSGDAGSNPDGSGHGSGGPLQAEYESSDPCVIGVGGTSLRLGPAGNVAAEVAWTGSGGGKSIFFARPPWQKGNGVPHGSKRLVPDVSITADPDFGAFVWLQGKRQIIGGTSWSAPVWAGICALLNEARQRAGKPPLPFLNPLLYPLNGSSCFREITQGTNGHYEAGPGYDPVTGIGVPNVQALVQELTK